jgi:hypothetical protein
MNTIYFSRRHELKQNYYVIPFSCSDLMNVNTEVSYRDRSESTQKVIQSVTNRIALALLNHGYILQGVDFSSMSVSAIIDTKAVQQSA